MRALLSSLAMLLLSAACALPGWAGERSVFYARSGRVVARFERVAITTYPAATDDIDLVDNVEYRVTFIWRGKNRVDTRYHDVYGNRVGNKPWPLADLFAKITWSPGEDFVLLPVEDWSSAPGSADRKALALDPGLSWSTANVHMDSVAWADRHRLIGNIQDDCLYKVAMFDGLTGKTSDIAAGSRPGEGYAVVSASGTVVVVGSMLDNCRTPEEEESFARRCERVDLGSGAAVPVPCPGE